MQAGGVVVEHVAHEPAPPFDARAGVVGGVGVERRPGTVHEVGHDLQVLRAAVGVGQLGRHRPHEGAGEGAHVGGAVGVVGVEHGVAPGLDLAAVLDEHGAQQAVAVAEVVLQRRGVLRPRGPVDLAEADPVDAVRGEQVLGRADQALGGGAGHLGWGRLGGVAGIGAVGQIMHSH